MDFKVVQDKGKADRDINSFTFTVGGQDSLMWYPTRLAVERAINRLKLGRSGEAFGGAATLLVGGQAQGIATSPGHGPRARGKVVRAGEATTATKTMKSGKTKVVEKQPGFIYELDGVAREGKIVTSEVEARALCATEAFMTRGKLGRFAEAEAQYKDQFGKECKVQVINEPTVPQLHRKVVSKDTSGKICFVGFNAGMNRDKIKFVEVIPQRPGG